MLIAVADTDPITNPKPNLSNALLPTSWHFWSCTGISHFTHCHICTPHTLFNRGHAVMHLPGIPVLYLS